MASNALVSCLEQKDPKNNFHAIISHGVEPTYIGRKKLLVIKIIEVSQPRAAVHMSGLFTDEKKKGHRTCIFKPW